MSQTPVPRVLVVGGTGHYGQHIVRSLVQRGASVRVLSRNAASARLSLGEAPNIVEGDITSETARRTALHGMDALVIAVSAMTPALIRETRAIEEDAILALLAEAKELAVHRVVFLSVYEVRRETIAGLDLASGRAKLHVEQALAASDLNWTVLGCAPSMQIFFAMMRGDTMMVPGGGPPALPNVSAMDVGEIAAQAALRDDLSSRRFHLVGPEALSFPEAAQRIAAVLGRPIRFRRSHWQARSLPGISRVRRLVSATGCCTPTRCSASSNCSTTSRLKSRQWRSRPIVC